MSWLAISDGGRECGDIARWSSGKFWRKFNTGIKVKHTVIIVVFNSGDLSHLRLRYRMNQQLDMGADKSDAPGVLDRRRTSASSPPPTADIYMREQKVASRNLGCRTIGLRGLIEGVAGENTVKQS